MATGAGAMARGLESSNSEAVAGLLQDRLGYRERPCLKQNRVGRLAGSSEGDHNTL